MRFLVDADLPRRTADLVRSFGHDAEDVRDLGPTVHLDPQIAEHAQANEMCLVSCDWGFADIRSYPPADYHGLIVLELPDRATSDEKLALLESLLKQPTIVSRLPGRLAIVSQSRIRLRPR